MKLQTKNNRYISSNCELSLNESLTDFWATSYGWWLFLRVDTVGNVIFNNTNYSSSTGAHQSHVMSILRRLGIKVGIMLVHTRDDGCSIDSEIKGIESKIYDLQVAMSVKGSWKKTNLQRANSIKYLEYEIKDLERFKAEYLDKKKMPYVKYGSYDSKYESFFLKPNGVLDRNGFNEFIKSMPSHYSSGSISIDKIVSLLGLKKSDNTKILRYEYLNDLNSQIPNSDTTEYTQLVRWLKNQCIDRENVNALSLDKMHVYLTNKLNKVAYTPSEPYQFPVSDKLTALQGTKGLTLLDTDRKLRAEGKRQNHCIGGKDYIAECKTGNQALNFKGYTFYLDSDCEILASTGSYNRPTPGKVIMELTKLLA